jgi:son of sevenless-like protein
MLIISWLSSCHLPVDQQLLSRMKNFCEVAIGVKTSSTMAKKGRELLQMIDERVGRFKCFLINLFLNLISQSGKDLIMSPTLSPSRKLLQDSDIAPRHLAIALTLLEGDKYKAIVPSDYTALLGKHPGSNGVKVACSVNNKIVLWVKQSVLHCDTAQSRAQCLEFFLNTAQVRGSSGSCTLSQLIKPLNRNAGNSEIMGRLSRLGTLFIQHLLNT